ncbi:hypothetical protein [Paraliobacillus salinarum]|uniref:hypothetical protein n=1 Tax=Paraliobacillus salinarum TaxID=1158996 RepID=UPI0015F3D46B|nr:hypothetical protein [Paraliobacillus salinarum]
MRKKYIGFILSFVFTVVTPLALSDELPTDLEKADDNTPVLLYDPGQGHTGS